MKAEEPLSDLQLRAIEAASEVFDRITRELGANGADGGGAGTGPTAGPAPHGAGPQADPIGQQQLRTAAARTIDLFAGLFQQAFETYVELAQSLVQVPAGVAVSAGAAAELSLAGQPGGHAAATVWIHNATQEPAREVVLRLSGLTCADGARLDAARARFVPAVLDVAAGASGSSMLSLVIPPHAAPGIYYGHVLAPGLPSALAVRLVVDHEATVG
jgi:hypothetical protein